jgi:transposase
MVSKDHMEFLREEGRRYIVGTPRSMLKEYEKTLLAEDWQRVREGLEVKLVDSPDGEETFILCRSADRRKKEQAMLDRFEKRIEEGLESLFRRLSKAKKQPDRQQVDRQIGRLLGKNSRAAGLFQIEVKEVEREGRPGLKVSWSKNAKWRKWASISHGCYILRTNVRDWSAQELWKAYIQLTEAELAFRIQKTDLQLRPIWHQKEDRVQAHILVCFLAYVLWKTLGRCCHRAGLGDEPRRVFDELSRIRIVDVVMPTRNGPAIRKRCVSRPTDHQAILLQRLGLTLPTSLPMTEM